MSCLTCGCCTACRPRYKRLVDAIYPKVVGEGLQSGDMQKLTFYAISHPEKLDRIGEYLTQRLSRDVYRQRTNLIKVAAEAMHQLLAACHGSPSLSLFVESFLKMVQKLLETQDPSLEMMATASFVSFSNIEEDTPGYHRRYDFFISKFAALCHNTHANPDTKRQLRLAGLRGLRGVVRKTVSADLQANIWEKQHMDKIVPSILYNFHDVETSTMSQKEIKIGAVEAESGNAENTEAAEDVPSLLADTCLRELIGKASFGSMKSVLIPVLQHCDLHRLWAPPAFAKKIFSAIIYSIQTQYSYVVIQALISHLDLHANDQGETRVGIAEVLSEIVLIASTGIGPSLLEIFNSLLRHLRSSVEFQLNKECPSTEAEDTYQETLINTMGDFANSLPDYQKVEIMMFIMSKVPLKPAEEQAATDAFLQHVLVKTLLKVATKYRTGNLSTVLSTAFLESLLKMALVEDPAVRILTQQILHTLLDRHQNLPALKHLDYVADMADLQLTVEKCARWDQVFMRKNKDRFFSTLYAASLTSNNSRDNFDAILCTLSLFCVEVGCDEVVIELFRLVLGLQSASLDPMENITVEQRAEIQNLIAEYINLASQLIAIPSLCQHVHQVVKVRAQQCHQSLNLLEGDPLMKTKEIRFPETIEELNLIEEALFDPNTIAEGLRASGRDAKALSVPFVPKSMSGDHLGGSLSTKSPSVDMTSLGSDSPDTSRRPSDRRNTRLDADNIPMTVDRLKQLLAQPPEDFIAKEEEKCREVFMEFRTKPLSEIVARRKSNYRDVEENINKILARFDAKEKGNNQGSLKKPKNIFELQLPELFAY